MTREKLKEQRAIRRYWRKRDKEEWKKTKEKYDLTGLKGFFKLYGDVIYLICSGIAVLCSISVVIFSILRLTGVVN